MNFKKLANILGKIMITMGALMVAPLIVSLIYGEGIRYALAYIIPIILEVGIGFLLQIPKPDRNSLFQKEGFALVGLAWIIMALFGALPLVIGGDIPHYVDAFFEIMSGFTTTGASIVTDVTALAHSTLFWRSFSHFIGGMGILVFILIFIPESDDGSSMHLFRAESSGPQVGKIVSKMKVTTRILYLTYLGMTLLEIIILLLDAPIVGYESDHLFNCILTAFGCAGTGGFGFVPGSIELYSAFSQYVISIFLILFGCNLTLYYLLIIGKIGQIFRSNELKVYLSIVVVAVIGIFVSLIGRYETIEECFRHSLFQVSSIITTTGYSTADFATWPMVAQSILILLMFSGAMAGSTTGALKVSRVNIAFKGAYIAIRKLINPRYVPKIQYEGKPLEQKTVNDVFAYVTLYLFILLVVMLLLSLDPINTQTILVNSEGGVTYEVTHGFYSNFSSALACLSNIGPGFEAVGAYSSYAGYSVFSKILLSFTMLLGRLEIFPVLILFNKNTWTK